MKPYTLCLHHLRLPARLGIFPDELKNPQTVEISLELQIDRQQCNFENDNGVPCYATLATQLQHLLLSQHTRLCEQLAERIAHMCFEDSRVLSVEVKIIKPQAVANAEAGVRVHISRAELVSS